MPLIEVVCTVLSKNHSDQCLLCLDLVNVLLEIRGKDVITVPELRNVLIETLKRENDDVIDYDLRVLVKYVQYSQELTSFIRHILKVGVGERCELDAGAGRAVPGGSRLPDHPNALQVHQQRGGLPDPLLDDLRRFEAGLGRRSPRISASRRSSCR